MQGKSTHGLRLDQLAELLRVAVAGADRADTEIQEDKKAETPQETLGHRVPEMGTDTGPGSTFDVPRLRSSGPPEGGTPNAYFNSTDQ